MIIDLCKFQTLLVHNIPSTLLHMSSTVCIITPGICITSGANILQIVEITDKINEEEELFQNVGSKRYVLLSWIMATERKENHNV